MIQFSQTFLLAISMSKYTNYQSNNNNFALLQTSIGQSEAHYLNPLQVQNKYKQSKSNDRHKKTHLYSCSLIFSDVQFSSLSHSNKSRLSFGHSYLMFNLYTQHGYVHPFHLLDILCLFLAHLCSLSEDFQAPNPTYNVSWLS